MQFCGKGKGACACNGYVGRLPFSFVAVPQRENRSGQIPLGKADSLGVRQSAEKGTKNAVRLVEKVFQAKQIFDALTDSKRKFYLCLPLKTEIFEFIVTFSFYPHPNI